MNDEQKKLVEDNMNLVYFIISRYFSGYIQNEDVIQEGMIGLCKAAIKYDETKCQFSTFASTCIYNNICRWFERQNKHNGVLSLDYPIMGEYDEITTFGENIVGESDIDYSDHERYFDGVRELDKKVLIMLSQGYNGKEIGEACNMTQQNVYRIKRKYEHKWRKNIGNN